MSCVCGRGGGCAFERQDLKSHNLLIDNNWTCKVCDFGLSKILTDRPTTSQMTSCGTPSWFPPAPPLSIDNWLSLPLWTGADGLELGQDRAGSAPKRPLHREG